MYASVYDALYSSVAEAEGVPVDEVREALDHRETFGDAFWCTWDPAVTSARELFRSVSGRAPLEEDA